MSEIITIELTVEEAQHVYAWAVQGRAEYSHVDNYDADLAIQKFGEQVPAPD